MATSVVLKKVPQQAVVKVLGPGSVTIDLAYLRSEERRVGKECRL